MPIVPGPLRLPNELTSAECGVRGLLDTIRKPIELLHKRSVFFGAKAADDSSLKIIPARASTGQKSISLFCNLGSLRPRCWSVRKYDPTVSDHRCKRSVKGGLFQLKFVSNSRQWLSHSTRDTPHNGQLGYADSGIRERGVVIAPQDAGQLLHGGAGAGNTSRLVRCIHIW